MPGYEEKLGPLSVTYEAKRKVEEEEAAARRAATPREEKKIHIPKDPNAAFAAGLEYSPAPELPTEEELQASWDKYQAMPPEEIYELKDPAGMLFEACQHLRDEHVKLLIERGSPTNYADQVRTERSFPALHACRRLLHPVCSQLYSYTPLHIAAFNGREKMVAYLLDAGADVLCKDIVRGHEFPASPLMLVFSSTPPMLLAGRAFSINSAPSPLCSAPPSPTSPHPPIPTHAKPSRIPSPLATPSPNHPSPLWIPPQHPS